MSKTPSIPAPFKPFRKQAWQPKVKPGIGPSTHSKFGGRPWIAPGEPWPECPSCMQPLKLFVQLNLNQIPKELEEDFGTGLLQLFYCTNDEPDCAVACEAWFPFSQSTVVRIVHPESPDSGSEEHESEEHEIEDSFPEKVIVGWEAVEDYPDPEEIEAMGVNLSDQDWEQLERLDDQGVSIPRDGDKLSGWPFWAQSPEYPDCPKCAGRMQLVFQIDSECNLPFAFGDSGCGHITQCEIHPDQVAFGWACA
ncbi:MAG: DUF1963 domain-containing protein [Synechococcales cyanobacterium CRU_2_2]|nr:DUF1963 domain-containing protein [Synechococcales cyanobacterium CRU_2_2]